MDGDSNSSLINHIIKCASNKNTETSSVKGNVPDVTKRLYMAVFQFFIDGSGSKLNSYGVNIGSELKCVWANVLGNGKSMYAETMYKVTVKEEMCNVFQTLHGACAAYFIDLCSVSSLVVLGLMVGFDGTGVSQSMNIIWHRPIRRGDEVDIKSTSMFANGRVRTIRCELIVNDTLCISAIHSVANPSKKVYDSLTSKL